MRILVLLAGDCPDKGLVSRIAASASSVICADGGVRHAIRLGLRPRFVLGDMDSLPKRLPPWKGTTYLCDFDEDASDFEKTLRFAAQADDPDLYVAGVFGGRPDHALVNLALAERYSQKMRLTLVDRGLARLAGPGRHELRCRKGQVVSLVSRAPGTVVTTRGLRYPLRRQRLEPGSRGLSNVATSDRGAVEIHRGKVWIVIPG